MTKLVGLALVGGAAALVAASMPEIKRYMKIREM
jgi:hypothetical protein